MAPSFAHLPPYARAAFIAAQLDALAGPDEPFEAPTEALIEQQAEAPLSEQVKAPVEAPPDTEPAPEKPKKKRKLAASTRAKTLLRAAKKAKNSTETDDSESSFEHHRRKCQVCNHPDREAIEELFIGWHSPRSIRIEFGTYHHLDCSSIYRHARAAGLYAKRRKNLRAVFDLILEHAGNIEPTAHGIAAIVRAYSCLTDTHDWIEPERRVHVVNHVYRHDLPVPPIPASSVTLPEPSVGADSSASAAPPALAVSGAPSFASGLRQAAQSEEVAKGGTSSATSSLESHLDTSHSPVLSAAEGPLATGISNRHTPEIRIASNLHKTNDRNISNRHISHSVSTQSEKEKRHEHTEANERKQRPLC